MRHLRLILVAALALAVFLPYQAMSAKGTPGPQDMLTKGCLNCHGNFKNMKDVLAGNFKSRSRKAQSIQVKINNRMEVVKYTAQTKVVNVPSIKALKGTIPLRVHYQRVGEDLVATKIVAKPKMKVPQEQLMSVEELRKLVALGPERGGYTLVDSRPGIKYNAGYIPTAISIPFPKMKSLKARLPRDKNRLLIFYCEGFR